MHSIQGGFALLQVCCLTLWCGCLPLEGRTQKAQKLIVLNVPPCPRRSNYEIAAPAESCALCSSLLTFPTLLNLLQKTDQNLEAPALYCDFQPETETVWASSAGFCAPCCTTPHLFAPAIPKCMYCKNFGCTAEAFIEMANSGSLMFSHYISFSLWNHAGYVSEIDCRPLTLGPGKIQGFGGLMYLWFGLLWNHADKL